ncbi:MAG: RsfA family transcriptional regulator [Alicyclobacillus sp.]|nr:RsfA family transcriptional regulator [Alicyclobacillus sp.]
MQSLEKWSSRSDAWTPEDDERLTAIVLHHIRTGSTQLKAFEEASAELGRTAAACGYRWNGVLRKRRRQEIEEAKRDRKTLHKPARTAVPVVRQATPASSASSMKEVILFLQTYDEQHQRLLRQLEQAEQERNQLLQRVQELETRLAHLPPLEQGPVTPEQLAEDSRTLFAIMERARKLLESDGSKTSGE